MKQGFFKLFVLNFVANTLLAMDGSSSALENQCITTEFSLQDFHWFPKRETAPKYRKKNNLYAEGGALHKLDKITGGEARKYEYEHHRESEEDAKPKKIVFTDYCIVVPPKLQKYEVGHSEEAAAASCLLMAPIYPVVMQAKDGTEVTFLTLDIQGLIIKVIKNLYKIEGMVSPQSFKNWQIRNRGNTEDRCPISEIYFDMFENYNQQGTSFVIPHYSEDYAFFYCAYDQIALTTKLAATASGSRIDLFVKLTSSANVDRAHVIKFYKELDGESRIIGSGSDDTVSILLVEARGNLQEKSFWIKNSAPSNPFVSPDLVYDIYMKSLKKPGKI